MKRIAYAISIINFCICFAGCTKKEQVTPINQAEPKTITDATAIATIDVPLAGNAFVTKPAAKASETISSTGLTNWVNSTSVTSTYFRLGQTGSLTVSIKAAVPSGSSSVKVIVNGTSFTVGLKGTAATTYAVGSVAITTIGYIKVDLQGISKTGSVYANVSDIFIGGTATTSNVVFANDPTNFYWSLRGPSVHLAFSAPSKPSMEWFYNEVTVPVGKDPIGSYYMVNGFSDGYAGIQVNSATQRTILFSVWDPTGGTTTLVKTGTSVTSQRFGGEGTGGQSLLTYSWKAGNTYKFITNGKPDGLGNTVYTCWFYAPELAKWTFIASWKKPLTNTYILTPYSFNECFNPIYGWQDRRALFSNQWAVTPTGLWVELTNAYFDTDATGLNKQRLDFKGGLYNGQFFLEDCGFFPDFVASSTNFTRPALNKAPAVSLTTLP